MKSELQLLAKKENCSWILLLNSDPETNKYIPNKTSREVKSGHYVKVIPTPLPNPYSVIFSSDMANRLGLSDNICKTNDFLLLFSGNIDTNQETIGKNSWATPYALSIYGKEIYDNCPFKNGNGYGDGRAISLSEIVIKNGYKSMRWELQLKGAGKTPFCRSGDGRAVLRSSIREFVASEAMFHLGVPTTRALSIIASDTEKVKRQWYDDKGNEIIEDAICAMLCRTASSFIRIGHIELFARRVYDKGASKIDELKLMVKHTIFREFPHLNNIPNEQVAIMMMLNEISIRLANLTANWIRVGYSQGNFNSDNCHISGQTIDYGPFGFIEVYDPSWTMWEGGGMHFAFMNQHFAGNKNFCTLVDAIIPLLNEENVNKATEMKQTQLQLAINAVNLVWAKKLGFKRYCSEVSKIVNKLMDLMEFYKADYTLFWRQLAVIVDNYNRDTSDYSASFTYLENCFYKKLSLNDSYEWIQWLAKWLALIKDTEEDCKIIAKGMKQISPKFVPREWMLKNAYEKANNKDYSILNEISKLFETPYDEHTIEMTAKYYKKMEFKDDKCCMAGTTVMTCSS